MTTNNRTFIADGTFTAPANMIDGGVLASVRGGVGQPGQPTTADAAAPPGNGSTLVGFIPLSIGDFITCNVAHWAGGAGGTPGTGTGGGTANGGYGGIGGASAACISSTAVILIEAAGGGGGGGGGASRPFAGSPGYQGGFGGGGGQIGSQPGTNGQGVSNFGGGGGAGGHPANGAGGVTSGGATAGAAGVSGGGGGGAGASGTTGGGGGGGGGGGWYGGGGGGGGGTPGSAAGGGGGGWSFVHGSVTLEGSFDGSNAISPYIIITYVTADAPFAPVLNAPASGTYEDSNLGMSFQFTAQKGTDSGLLNGALLRIKQAGGSYLYWNGTSFVSSPPGTWPMPVDDLGSIYHFTIPAGLLADGVTYNWSVATQESYHDLQGPFASDSIFFAVPRPVVNVTGPPSPVRTSNPTVTWAASLGAGLSQIGYDGYVYELSTTLKTGFNPQQSAGLITDFAGTTAANSAVLSSVNLQTDITYVVYVRVTETGGISSLFGSRIFTVKFDSPATPSLLTAAETDSSTGCPITALTSIGIDNIMSAEDSTFELGLGSWAPYIGCTLAPSTTVSLDGTASMEIIGGVDGAAYAIAGEYAVVPGQMYTAMAAMLAATIARVVHVNIYWYDSSFTLLSINNGDGYTDGLVDWVFPFLEAEAPGGAAFARLLIQIDDVSVSGGEIHNTDTCGIFPGTLGYDLTILNDGPSNYWPLDDVPFSTTVTDLCGSAGAGAVMGGITFGKQGFIEAFPGETGAKFDGTSGFIQTALPLGQQVISFEAWVDIEDISGSNFQTIISTGNPAGGAGEAGWWLLQNADEILFLVGISTSSQVSAPITLGRHHIVATHTSGHQILYIDGVQAAAATFSGTVGGATFNARIGVSHIGFQKGTLGNIAIYPTVLTDTQVFDHYKAAKDSKTSQVQRWSIGGFANQATTVEMQGSADLITWADIRDVGLINEPDQTTYGTDYEGPFAIQRYYRCRTIGQEFGQSVASNWSIVKANSLETDRPWLVDPLSPGLDADGNPGAIPLYRTSSRVGSTASGIRLSHEIDQIEQQGSFQPFGRVSTVLVRGDLYSPSFDLALWFGSLADWEAFDALRKRRVTLCFRSDMPGELYYIALGPNRPRDMYTGADRTTPQSMTEVIVVCIPQDKP